ncbi:Vitamin B12 import ATP-binding protein BtuD [Massilia sp. Bi118]|uniref:AAA family ATPase n=1 Tax=Massilia sp. Bi118 TaxID=2822346 RepID=UPI001DA28263|nr:AAA family ATPase [Massilia sp. Bi118]CAH0219184.1 Vitamin B12 import ATP-binding protein BtuD [Massilia sp. Bi118]
MSFAAKPYLRSVAIAPGAEPDLDEYPFTIPAVRELGLLEPHPDVTFFVGENGAGKSTVLEAIAVELGMPAEGGNRSVLREQQAVSPLHGYLKLVKSFRQPSASYFLRAESLFNVFTYMDEVGGSVRNGRGLHLRSHGEAFMDLMSNFRDGGLYLLDEPEAALSPNRQLAALSVIDRLVKAGSQFIIATHSPILLAYQRAKILLFDETGISHVDYEDTEHYAVTRDFLNHYPRRLQQLLEEE